MNYFLFIVWYFSNWMIAVIAASHHNFPVWVLAMFNWLLLVRFTPKIKF